MSSVYKVTDLYYAVILWFPDDDPLWTEIYRNNKCYILLLFLTLQPYMGCGLLRKITPDSSIFDDLAPN